MIMEPLTIDNLRTGDVDASHGWIKRLRSCPSSLPNRPRKRGPIRGPGATFPLWLAAGPACWQSDGAAIPLLSIHWKMLLIGPPTLALGHLATFRPTESP